MSAKATGKVSAAVMASRVLGMARDMMFGGLSGGSRWIDCFNLAFRIPNLLHVAEARDAVEMITRKLRR